MKYWSSDTSFGIHTDRYPDTMHIKIQTASSILSGFFEALNLGNILKIHLSTPAYEQAFPRKATTAHSVALCS